MSHLRSLKSGTFKEFQEGDFQGVLKVRLSSSYTNETLKSLKWDISGVLKVGLLRSLKLETFMKSKTLHFQRVLKVIILWSL